MIVLDCLVKADTMQNTEDASISYIVAPRRKKRRPTFIHNTCIRKRQEPEQSGLQQY